MKLVPLIILLILHTCTSKFLGIDDPDYNLIVKQISTIVKTNSSTMHHGSFNKLAYIVDTFGPRMWGSPTLELVLQELQKIAASNQLDTRLEPVTNFTRWVRGQESLTLYDPRPFPSPLKMIGLGKSIPGNVTAEVLVVTSFEDLDNKYLQALGKIVCYSIEYVNYSASVNYRVIGASYASKYGAVGALIRSITPFSIESPHTGIMYYDKRYPKIPIAAIAVEDAYMLKRMQARGQRIVVNLLMESTLIPNTNSNNFIAEIKGSVYPEQIVLFGGHVDSWDTGSQTGANDDGGGIMTCLEALIVIKKLGLKPKRTLRVIGWSGEEFADPNNGAQQYARNHASELKDHVVAFESDLGSTKPYGFGFSGNAGGLEFVSKIATQYLRPLNASEIIGNGEAADTAPLFEQGIPTMINLIQDNPNHDFYFTYHHSAGDTMEVMNPDEMDDNVVAIASMLYIIADSNERLPRN